MPDPIIRHESSFGGDFVDLPRISTVVLKKGWLLSLESNTIVNMDLAAENTTFAGVAYTNHETGDPIDVTSLLKCILEIDNTSATFDLGAGVKYSAGSASAVYTVVADGSADTIGWANQIYASAVTRMLIRIDVPMLGDKPGTAMLYNTSV